MTEEMEKVVDELIEKREEEENMIQEVVLTEIESLKIQNIFLKQQILQEQLKSVKQEMELLADAIKARTGAPPDSEVGFDPQNLTAVRIGKLVDAGDSA
jgi:hypothetical protein